MFAHYQYNVPDLRRRAALTASVLASLQLSTPLSSSSSSLLPIEQPADDLPLVYRILFSLSVPSSPVSSCSANGVGLDRNTSGEARERMGGNWGGGARGVGELMRRKGCEPPVRHLTKSWGGTSGAIPIGSFVREPRNRKIAPDEGSLCARWQRAFPLSPPNRCKETRRTCAACSECELWPSC